MKIDKILDLFDLRPIEKEVFRVCFDADGVGASEIAKKVGINRTSTYDFLDKLVKIGLVVESQKQGIKTFYSQKPEQIELLINEKKQKITIATQVIGEFKKDFYTNAKRTIPRMQIYEGKEELRQMMKDMLLYHDLTVYSFWPIKNIIQTLGKEFYSDFHKKRVTSNLHIKVLWPKKHSNLREKHFFLS
jgi:sugar-specific transcriptional regulator TrmB